MKIMNKLLVTLIVISAHIVYAQNGDVQWSALVGKSAEKSSVLPTFTIEKKKQNLADEIPQEVLNAGARFFTLSVENDKFGNGTDKDYTNGLRITYYNTSADQPFYVDWIDLLTPTYSSNETSSSYFSFGHNLYTPKDITETTINTQDRPYAAFLYGSAGVMTLTGRHVDNVELTLGWVGPSAMGEKIQTEFHELIHSDKPMGWKDQIKDEPGIILSWERSWPEYWAATIDDNLFLRVAPHAGVTLGNIYTYANAGFTIDLTPRATRWQTQPVRVRPAIPGSGYFETGEVDWSWMLFAGWDTRLMARNIFLDGNTFKSSHSVEREWLVHDAAVGATVNMGNWRTSYTLNWRSREFDSPLADDQFFGSLSLTYRF